MSEKKVVLRLLTTLPASGSGEYKGKGLPRLFIPADIIKMLGFKKGDRHAFVTLWSDNSITIEKHEE